jgi:hypothetical protein
MDCRVGYPIQSEIRAIYIPLFIVLIFSAQIFFHHCAVGFSAVSSFQLRSSVSAPFQFYLSIFAHSGPTASQQWRCWRLDSSTSSSTLLCSQPHTHNGTGHTHHRHHSSSRSRTGWASLSISLFNLYSWWYALSLSLSSLVLPIPKSNSQLIFTTISHKFQFLNRFPLRSLSTFFFLSPTTKGPFFLWYTPYYLQWINSIQSILCRVLG